MPEKKLLNSELEQPEVPDICGAAVDLINPSNSPASQISLATIYIEPRKTSTPHYHKVTEEIYYFIQGNGRVFIDKSIYHVGPGSAIYIPVQKLHYVVNDSESVRLK